MPEVIIGPSSGTIRIVDRYMAASDAEMTALTQADQGDVCIRTDTGRVWLLTNDNPALMENWQLLPIPPDLVALVNGYAGPDVTLTAADVAARPDTWVPAWSDVTAKPPIADVLRVPSDQSFSNATLADVSGLSSPVVANGVYAIMGWLDGSTPASTGLRLQFSAPAGATLELGIASLTDNGPSTFSTIRVSNALSTPFVNSNTNAGFWFVGHLRIGATAGTFKVRAAQGTANATASVIRLGSYLSMTKTN